MMQVQLFDEKSLKPLLALSVGSANFTLPVAERIIDGALVWTSEPLADGKPSSIVVNCKSEQLVFDVPSLVKIDSKGVLLKALQSRPSSGTSQQLRVVYLLLTQWE